MGTYEIETSTSVASVKGTEFLIKIDENGNTIIYTISGIVSLNNKKSGETIFVNAGEKGTSGSESLEKSKYDKSELGQSVIDETDDSSSQMLKIEMEHPDNSKKTIEIEFE